MMKHSKLPWNFLIYIHRTWYDEPAFFVITFRAEASLASVIVRTFPINEYKRLAISGKATLLLSHLKDDSFSVRPNKKMRMLPN